MMAFGQPGATPEEPDGADWRPGSASSTGSSSTSTSSSAAGSAGCSRVDRALAVAHRPRPRRGHLRDRARRSHDGGDRARRRHRRRRLATWRPTPTGAGPPPDDGLGRASCTRSRPATWFDLRGRRSLLGEPRGQRARGLGVTATAGGAAAPALDGERPDAKAQAKRGAGVERSRPLRPDLQIVQTQVFRGPNYFSYDPAIRLARRPRLARALAVEHDPGVQRHAARAAAGRRRALLLARARAAGSASGSRRARGPATSPSTSRSSCSASRARTSTAGRRAAPARRASTT